MYVLTEVEKQLSVSAPWLELTDMVLLTVPCVPGHTRTEWPVFHLWPHGKSTAVMARVLEFCPRQTNKNLQITKWWSPEGKLGAGEVEGKEGQTHGDGRSCDFGWVTIHALYRWCIVGSCTWNLCIFITQCNPNTFNKNKISIGVLFRTQLNALGQVTFLRKMRIKMTLFHL